MNDAQKDYIEPVYYITPEKLLRSFSGNLISQGRNMLIHNRDKIATSILVFKTQVDAWIQNHENVVTMEFNNTFRGETRTETGYGIETNHKELWNKIDEIIRNNPEIALWNEPADFYFVDLEALIQNIMYDMRNEK